MTKNRSKRQPKVSTSQPPKLHGTAVLGVVVSDLVVCSVFGVTDEQANYIAKGITTAILSRFTMELLDAAGVLGTPDQY